MGRLTTDKKVDDMSMVELAHNCCYSKDGTARYRDYDKDIDAREFARNLMVEYEHWKADGSDTDNELIDEDIFDESIMENLIYEPEESIGLIALFYRNLWAMADLREKLKAYEDIIDDPEKLKLIDALYLEKCEEINRLNAELAEYKKLEKDGLLLRLPCKVGVNHWIFNTDCLNWNEYKIEYVKCVDYRIDFYNPYLRYHIMDNPFASRVIFKGKDDKKYSYCFEDIPTHVFLTKEEAEQALERIKEVQDVN